MKNENLSDEQINIINNGGQAPAKQTNGFAIAGFILAWLFAILGLVFSILGLQKSRETSSGRGLSIAGIIIAVLNMIAGAILQFFVADIVNKIEIPDSQEKCKYVTKCSVRNDGKYDCEYIENGKKYTIKCDSNPYMEYSEDIIDLDEE